MNNTVTLPATKVNQILRLLSELNQKVSRLAEKLEDLEPVYGSNEWWEWSDRKALKSIAEGKGIVIRNQKELGEFFKSL